MDRLARAQVADHYHGTVIHFIGHDVEISVVIEIKHHRGARAERSVDDGLGAELLAEHAGGILTLAVEEEHGLVRAATRARFHSEQELRVKKALPLFVEQDGVDGVAERPAHAGGDENILVAIGIEVAHARSPRPVRLRTNLIGNFLKRASAPVAVEGVAENVVR